MFLINKIGWAKVAFAVFTAGMSILSLNSLAFAGTSGEEKAAVLHRDDIKKLQESLRDKGYYHSQVDGVLGPQTRAAISQYQKAEKLPATGRLDAPTAGKLGVGPESIGGSFKGAGQEVGKGGQELGHEMKQGKPLAAGKELGKGVGRAGKKIGQGVKGAVTTDSDRGDREKKKP